MPIDDLHRSVCYYQVLLDLDVMGKVQRTLRHNDIFHMKTRSVWSREEHL